MHAYLGKESSPTNLFIGYQASEVFVISNDTALRTGETALLACVGFGEEISWSFNGAPVVNTSLITICEEDVAQGERIFKQSFLHIRSLGEGDAGGYTCIISDGFTTTNATTQLTVTSKFMSALSEGNVHSAGGIGVYMSHFNQHLS